MTRLLVALLLVSAPLTGCTFDQPHPPLLSFLITAEITLTGEGAEALMFPPSIDGGHANLTLEYDGPAMDAEDIVISYLDTAGRLLVQNASNFGAPAKVSKGTRFVVPEVNLTSNFTVLAFGQLRAERALSAETFFTREGVVGLSRIEPGAEASWHQSNSVSNASDDAHLRHAGEAEATLTLVAASTTKRVASGFGTFEAINISAATTSSWSASTSLEYSSPAPEGGTTSWSRERLVEVAAFVTVDGRLFETRSGGGERVDLTTTFWNATIPRDSPREQESPHPYRDEIFPQEKTAHPAVPLEAAGWKETLAASLARTRLRAGDSIEYAGFHEGATLRISTRLVHDDRGTKVLSTGELKGGDGGVITLRATSAILDATGWYPIDGVSRRSLNATIHEFATEQVGLIPAATAERLLSTPALVSTDSMRLVASKGTTRLSPLYASLAAGYPFTPPNAPGEEWQVLMAGGGDARLCVLHADIPCSTS